MEYTLSSRQPRSVWATLERKDGRESRLWIYTRISFLRWTNIIRNLFTNRIYIPTVVCALAKLRNRQERHLKLKLKLFVSRSPDVIHISSFCHVSTSPFLLFEFIKRKNERNGSLFEEYFDRWYRQQKGRMINHWMYQKFWPSEPRNPRLILFRTPSSYCILNPTVRGIKWPNRHEDEMGKTFVLHALCRQPWPSPQIPAYSCAELSPDQRCFLVHPRNIKGCKWETSLTCRQRLNGMINECGEYGRKCKTRWCQSVPHFLKIYPISHCSEDQFWEAKKGKRKREGNKNRPD